jgi:hypothetical protein
LPWRRQYLGRRLQRQCRRRRWLGSAHIPPRKLRIHFSRMRATSACLTPQSPTKVAPRSRQMKCRADPTVKRDVCTQTCAGCCKSGRRAGAHGGTKRLAMRKNERAGETGCRGGQYDIAWIVARSAIVMRYVRAGSGYAQGYEIQSPARMDRGWNAQALRIWLHKSGP